MMRRRSSTERHRERERESLTNQHTHTAVENHAVDLRLIQRLTKRDTTLSSRRKKKFRKTRGFLNDFWYHSLFL
jgi:hypothetical protein